MSNKDIIIYSPPIEKIVLGSGKQYVLVYAITATHPPIKIIHLKNALYEQLYGAS